MQGSQGSINLSQCWPRSRSHKPLGIFYSLFIILHYYCRKNFLLIFSFYFVSDSSEVIDLLFFFFTFIPLLLKSSDFRNFDYISWQNWCFTSQIRYDDFIFLKFIQFPDFSGFSRIFRIFPDFFPDLSRFSRFKDFLNSNKSLLCSRSRTLRI